MKTIPNYPKYSISECGTQVMNNESGARLKISDQQIKGKNTGYKYVTLIIDNRPKRISAHRLVAFAYIPNPEFKVWVNHKDGNKSNNHYTNLEWTTISENIQHAFETKLRTMPRGEKHWLYGTKASTETKKLQSDAKSGENHPKFKGFYYVRQLEFTSANSAAKHFNECSRTVLRKCKNGEIGSDYYYLPI